MKFKRMLIHFIDNVFATITVFLSFGEIVLNFQKFYGVGGGRAWAPTAPSPTTGPVLQKSISLTGFFFIIHKQYTQ